MDRKIVPLILTCDRAISITEEFVKSFHSVQANLERPICVVDLSSVPEPSPQYLSLLSTLNPRAIHYHAREADLTTYNSAQAGAGWALRKAVETTATDEMVLFLEDDIIFSKHFIQQLYSYQLKPDAGFVTFYLPFHGYGSRQIQAEKFYGTQCLLFPKVPLMEIVDNYDYLISRFPQGYDLQWAKFLAERGYKLYASDFSYVQHIGNRSQIHNSASTHQSLCFINNEWSDVAIVLARRLKWNLMSYPLIKRLRNHKEN